MTANIMDAGKKLKVALVGAGSRGMHYMSYVVGKPEILQVTAVVEPDEYRRSKAADMFGIPEQNCCKSVEELIEKQLDFTAVVNGTMDRDHITTSLPLLEAGYDMLLEKPICVSKDELLQIYQASRKYNRKIMVCHVLRYAPFYVEIKNCILNGEIGEILNINTEENVSYHHYATSFIRGKWNNSDICGSKIMMQKCCHDLDIISWLKSGIAPRYVGSLGGLKHFRPDNAPEGSGTRCLTDCLIESSCPYSAKKLYLERGLWSQYVWRPIQEFENNMTDQIKLESLKKDNPWGRCVWHCDNNVEDHQSVIIEFQDGSTATHTLTGGTSKPSRTIHISGTKGDIYGVMDEGYFIIRHPDIGKSREYSEERVEISVQNDMHGGGDEKLVLDFANTMKGEIPSISCTSLEDSIYGHLIGFTAEEALVGKKFVEIENLA